MSISLSDTLTLNDDDNASKVVNLNNVNGLEKKPTIRPAYVSLKSIGLSMIKIQYTENSQKSLVKKVSEDSNSKPKEELWQSVWADDQYDLFYYHYRHLLEQRSIKTYKCTFSRSRLCQNSTKMTRLNWIHHARRGHARISTRFKYYLKKSNDKNIDKAFEILCIVCNKNNRPNYMSPSQLVQHMSKRHPQFLPYNEYFSYFQRCFMCNETTTSFSDSLLHRQKCLPEMLRDPNQLGTEDFNKCFQPQRQMLTASLQSSSNQMPPFDIKLKQFNNYKNTCLYFWTHIKRGASSQPAPKPVLNNLYQNGALKASQFQVLRSNVLASKSFSNCSLTISDRIKPGAPIDVKMAYKFLLPVPFIIKNDIASKQIYSKWRKSVPDDFSKIQSNAPWYCEICNTMLKNIRSAYCHINMCHPSVEFEESTCKTCEKRFLTSNGYKKHLRGLKNCPIARRCVVCDASVSINDIYQHTLKDHKEASVVLFKLKTCLICRTEVDDIHGHLFDIHGMPDTVRAQPDIGVVTYNNGTFYNCGKCALTYFTELELRSHMITNNHHFECSECPALKFYLCWELMRHRANSHSAMAAQDTDDRRIIICDLCPATTFGTVSEKVHHFIGAHLTPCTVQLNDVLKGGHEQGRRGPAVK